MNWTSVRRFLALLLLVVSLAALIWGLWPLPHQTRSLVVSPEEMLPAELTPAEAGELPAIAQSRLLFLEWPSAMRTGDPATIRLMIGFVEQGRPSIQVNPLTGGSYSVLAEARLELPAIPHTPLGEVSQALQPGRAVTFIWEAQPNRAGDAHGTVWLHLHFIPTAGGPDLRQVLTAQRIDIHVTDFLGLSGPWARALGSAGVVVGAVLGLDGVAIWLWQRQTRKQEVRDA